MANRKALFLHIKNLLQLVKKLDHQRYENTQVLAVSARPRKCSHTAICRYSWPGTSLAQSLAAFAQVPLYLREAIRSGMLWLVHAGQTGNSLDKPRFLAVHFSGGTSDVLSENHQPGFHVYNSSWPAVKTFMPVNCGSCRCGDGLPSRPDRLWRNWHPGR